MRRLSAPARPRCALWGAFRSHLPCGSKQTVSRHVQVRQRKERHHLRRVLHQSPVAGLHITELALDHPEGVLHLGADARLERFDLSQARAQRGVWQRTALARPHRAVVQRFPIIKGSSLYGLTFGDDFVEAYYVGDPNDTQAINQFTDGAKRAGELITIAVGEGNARVGRSLWHLWPYGRGDGGIGWPGVHSDVSAEPGILAAGIQRAKSALGRESDVASPQRGGSGADTVDRGSPSGIHKRPAYRQPNPEEVQVVGAHL